MLVPDFELFMELFNDAKERDAGALVAKKDLVSAQLEGGSCCRHPAMGDGTDTISIAELHRAAHILAAARSNFETGIGAVATRHRIKERVLPTTASVSGLVSAIKMLFMQLGVEQPPIEPKEPKIE